MKTIRNKRTGEVRVIADHEVDGFIPKAQNGYQPELQQTASGLYRWPKAPVGYIGGPSTGAVASAVSSGPSKLPASTKKGSGMAGMDFGGAADVLAPFFAGNQATQIQPGQTTVNFGQSTGGTVLSGAGKGAAVGTSIVPGWGTVIGAAVGAIGGGITALRERGRESEEEKQLNSVQRHKYQDLDYDPNLDPYGNERVFYAQEGGMPPEEGQQEEAPQEEGQGQQMQQPQQPQDQRQIVDVEKGELLTDPMTLDILYKYENPNKYSRHAKNPQKEPVGNFTKVEPGHVVISRKYAKTYEKGDTLTRKSIIMEIMKNQRNNPQEMTPAPGGMENVEEATYAQKGARIGQAYKMPHVGYGGVGHVDNERPTKEDPYGGVRQARDYQFWLNDPENDPYTILEGKSLDPGTQFPGENEYKPNPIIKPLPKNPSFFSTAPQMAHFQDDEETPPPPGKKRWRPSMTDAALGLNFAATAYGLATAGKDEQEYYDENFGYDRARSAISGMETNPSIEASRTSMDQMVANRNKGLNNINSPSTRAEAASSFSDMLKGKNELIQNATNASMDARNKKLGALAELDVKQGGERLAARTKLHENLQMNRANKHKLIQSGLSELSQNVGAQVMDQNRLNAINSVLEYAKVKNSGEQVDTKEFSKKIAAIVSSDYYNEGDLEKLLDGYVRGKTKDRKVAKATNQKTNNTRH